MKKFFTRLVATFVILCILYMVFERQSFPTTLTRGMLSISIIMMCLFIAVQNLIHAFRLCSACKIFSINLSLNKSFEACQVGGLISFTPASLAGSEAARFAILNALITDKKTLISILLLDRLYGLTGMAITAVISFIFLSTRSTHQYLNGFMVPIIVICSLFIISVFAYGMMHKKLHTKNRIFIIAHDLLGVTRHSGLLLTIDLITKSLIMSLVIPFGCCACAVLLDFKINLFNLFCIASFSMLASFIPIGIGGIGVREAAFTTIATALSEPVLEALTLSIFASISLLLNYSQATYYFFKSKA